MITWKTLKTLCTALLLVPVIHLGHLLFIEYSAAANRSPDIWRTEIQQFITSDQKNSIPNQAAVVVGSRQVNSWHSLKKGLNSMPVLLRGLGHATVDDINHNYLRLVGYYQPKLLIVVLGSQEFHVRKNQSPAELLESVKALVLKDRSFGNLTSIYIIPPIKTPILSIDYARIDQSTALLKDWAQTQYAVTIVDANPILVAADNKPDIGLFLANAYTLNEAGLQRLSDLIRNQQSHEPSS